ncbi:MAG: hypothetical protein WCJ60_03730 [bacterium]
MSEKIRPTKKQKELLQFIESFISEHGYSPSYREIMNGVGYTSVATVALHVSNLVKRGHLVKRDNSARSLEPTKNVTEHSVNKISEADSAWLFEQIEQRFKQANKESEQSFVDELYVLIGAVKVLGYKDQAVAYITRLRALESLNAE